MRQFMLGVVVAVGLVWGYSQWSAGVGNGRLPAGEDLAERLRSPATAPANDMDAAGHEGANADPASAVSQAGSTGPSAGTGVPLDARGAASRTGVSEDTLAAATAGDAAALGAVWGAIARDSTPAAERSRLQGVLDQALGAAEDPDAVLASLGSSNAFLHTEAGRQRIKQLLHLMAPLPDERVLGLSTRLIEACMRGSIEKRDEQAHAAVDTIWAAHRVRADRWLCDPANVTRARSHTVAKGDSLQRIAGRFRREKILVDAGTIAILNRIHNPNALQAGQKIKVPVDPIRAVVEKRSFLLAVYVGDVILRLYWVGHGADSKTPVAEFTVADKLEKPDWYAPDGNRHPYGSPDNILGDYFIKFSNPSYTGFGAHGTPMPETIGTMSSMGCIRMYAADIAELFRLLPRDAKVEIRDSQ